MLLKIIHHNQWKSGAKKKIQIMGSRQMRISLNFFLLQRIKDVKQTFQISIQKV